MPRIFLPDTRLSPGVITITGEKARYLTVVLRAKSGDPISVRDGTGASFLSRVVDVARREVTVEILSETEHSAESPLQLVLVQGMLKGEKMDMVIQKTVELGVHQVRPVVAERSQVRITRKADRWRKIAEEAARQCGRNRIPEVADPVELSDYLDNGRHRGIIFWEEGGMPLQQTLARASSEAWAHPQGGLHLLVGPEGGFSAAEVQRAADLGFIVASLGPRTLRAETASIAAVAVIQHVLGDMGA